MKTILMSGSRRGNVGKKDSKKQRKQGLIPCVIYGGKDQLHFLTDEKNFKKLIFTPETYLVKLNVDGQEFDAILQDVQYHPVTDRVLHVDLLEVVPDKPVLVSLPILDEGIPEGVLKGGRLIRKLRKLKVKGLVNDIPDNVTVNVSTLEIGQSVKVSDITLANLQLMDSPHTVVIGVRTSRAVEEVVEEGEGKAEEGGVEGQAKPAELKPEAKH